MPLGFQQLKVIDANCDLRAKYFCGEMGVDLWDKAKWQEFFEELDVLVMTAQIFLNLLHHAFLSLSQVNLLVFDECHHATKSHPYNLIMNTFYNRCTEENRPKIFGMTASPSNKGPPLAIDLERNLDSKIFTAISTEELRQFVN